MRAVCLQRNVMVQIPLPVKAVTIDLDGTLLDTVTDLTLAVNMMLKQLGQPPLAEELVRTFVGKGISNLVQRALAGALNGEPDAALYAKALPIYLDCYEGINGTSHAPLSRRAGRARRVARKNRSARLRHQ